ncbi:hypothetical protein [Aurantiacibacter gangjinensis]|nr:hypothetical protein [Aurantiacibacter gangjinensis]APE29325.1 hypothetical protein BMF35_b0070 [Aurantiacibacter gangjinensis]
MLNFAHEAAVDVNAPRAAKPRKIDRKELRKKINENFSKSLEYLSK